MSTTTHEHERTTEDRSTPPAPPRRRRITIAVTTIVLGGALTITGCSVGSSDSSAGGVQAPVATEAPSQSAQGEAAQDSSVRKASAPGGAVTVQQARLARKASLDITVDDVDKAAATIRSTAATADGTVTSEEFSSDEDHGWGEIVVSVPATKLDETLDELAKVGTVERRASSTTDETSKYTDTQARITTMRASIKRVQKLIDSTSDIDQLVSLEDELSTRQADLDSLLGQLESLKNRTTMSPVTISLTEKGAPAEVDEDEGGFTAGFAAGWDAFTRSMQVALTALGALTPFALLGAALVAPVVVWWRRRRRVSPAPLPAAGGPAPRQP